MSPKVARIYRCKECDYTCFKNSDYDKHILTAKHNKMTNRTILNAKVAKSRQSRQNPIYTCECGKEYKVRNSLWYHKKKCMIKQTIIKLESVEKPSILYLLSQNKDLMEMLVLQNSEHKKETSKILEENTEMLKTIQDIVPKIGNNNNNNNNHQFNIQVFLNEECKDAINFSDFIKQIQVSLTDLENQAENGYIKGITKIFIENLQGLGMNKRPIHCTDKKRKTLYIKENNEWDKEGSQDILKKGIQEVTRRTFEQLINEQKIHSEEYNDADSEFSMKCISIQRNLTPNHPRENTIGKVIDNITQNTGIA